MRDRSTDKFDKVPSNRLLGFTLLSHVLVVPPTAMAVCELRPISRSAGDETGQVMRMVGIEGAIADIVTTSPFDEGDTENLPGFDIPKPHNVHTTVGIRYRF